MDVESRSVGVRARLARFAAVMTAAVLAFVALGFLGGCGAEQTGSRSHELVLATTTSVRDSGLMDRVVLPAFKKLHPDITVKMVAIGSGDAIAMGRRGDADVLVVHSPADEDAFMAAGDGTLRLPVAYNYFTLVGPTDDPAGVRSSHSAAAAFAAIARKRALFVSRGDASGTNRKELSLWAAAGVTNAPAQAPGGSWYLKSGQGMGATLQIASEKGAYTLTDLGTYLAMKHQLNLVPLLAKSADLRNQYNVIIVNQARHPQVNAAGAELFAAYLVSPEGQRAIGGYGVKEYGRPLFTPDAGSLGQ